MKDFQNEISAYLNDDSYEPLFLVGDSFNALKTIPACSIDLVATSPPFLEKENILAYLWAAKATIWITSALWLLYLWKCIAF